MILTDCFAFRKVRWLTALDGEGQAGHACDSSTDEARSPEQSPGDACLSRMIRQKHRTNAEDNSSGSDDFEGR